MAGYILAPMEYMETAGIGVTGAATASTSLAVTNAITPQPSELVRFASLTGMYIEFDLVTAQTVDTVWCGYSNATSDATIRIRAAASQANLTAAPDYDSTAVQFWPNTTRDLLTLFPRGVHSLTYMPLTATRKRWWRLDFVDASNPDGYFQFGIAIFGQAWAPTHYAAAGAGLDIAKATGRSDAMGGPSYRRGLTGTNILDTSHPYLTESEFLALRDIQRRRAHTKPVLAVLLPDNTLTQMDNTAFGYLETTDTSIPAYNNYSARVRVVETY